MEETTLVQLHRLVINRISRESRSCYALDASLLSFDRLRASIFFHDWLLFFFLKLFITIPRVILKAHLR